MASETKRSVIGFLCWLAVLLLLFAPALVRCQTAPYVKLTGTLQGPNGLPVANNVISLQPTQMFYIPDTNSTTPVDNIYGNGAPTGICLVSGQIYIDNSTVLQGIYQCQYGVWVAIHPSTLELQHNGIDLASQSLLNFLDATPSLPANSTRVTFTSDAFGGLGAYVPSFVIGDNVQLDIAPPTAGQWVYIFPTSVSTSTTGATYVHNVGNTSAQLGNTAYCSLGSGTATVTWTGFDVSLAALGISPSQVTAIYPFAYATNQYGPGGGTVCGPISPVTYGPNLLAFQLLSDGTGATPLNFSPVSPAILQYKNGALTGLTAANFSSLTVTASATVGSSTVGPAEASVELVGAWIEYTGTPVTQPNKIDVVAPLSYNAETNQLSVSTPLDIGTDVGTANNYQVNISWLSQTPLTTVKFLPAHLSTITTPTFDLNGEGALPIVGPIGNALSAGDLDPNIPAVVIFGLNNKWYLQDPVVSGTGAGVSGGSNLASLVSTKISVGKVSPAAASSFIVGNSTLNTIDTASALATYNAIVGGSGNTLGARVGGFIGGGVGNTASTLGDYSSILGGQNNSATGAGSTVIGGASNSATNSYAIAGGNNSHATGNLSLALGDTNTASGPYSVALGGHNTASGSYTTALGNGSSASGNFSTVLGGNASDYGNIGTFAFTGTGGPAAGSSFPGRAQREEHILWCTSSGNAATCRMTADGAAAAATNVAAIRNTSSAMFTVDVLAADKTTGANLTWTFGPSLITRAASAATTAMSSTNPAATAGPTTATPPAVGTPTVTADTTNGGYNVSITTPAGNTDTWYMLCVIHELVTQYN